MPVDHLSELPGVVLLHEEDGLPGLLLHAGGAGGDAGAAEHAGSDGCKKNLEYLRRYLMIFYWWSSVNKNVLKVLSSESPCSTMHGKKTTSHSKYFSSAGKGQNCSVFNSIK